MSSFSPPNPAERFVGPLPPEIKPSFEFAKSEFSVSAYSLPKEGRLSGNEDAFFIDRTKPAVGVFDGIGSHAGSDVAASIAAVTVQKNLEQAPTVLDENGSMKVMRDALEAAHQAVVAESKGSKIGTTASIAKLFKTYDGRPYAAFAHVADSRVYMQRQGKLSRLTLDSGLTIHEAPQSVKDLEDKLSEVMNPEEELSEYEQAEFNDRNVINTYLGETGRISPLIVVEFIMVEPGDRLILTTDGIHDNLTASEIEHQIKDFHGDIFLPHVLIGAAQNRSREYPEHPRAKPDDMTVASLTYMG